MNPRANPFPFHVPYRGVVVDETCTCRHRRTAHNSAGAFGHGDCRNCACTKFTFQRWVFKKLPLEPGVLVRTTRAVDGRVAGSVLRAVRVTAGGELIAQTMLGQEVKLSTRFVRVIPEKNWKGVA